MVESTFGAPHSLDYHQTAFPRDCSAASISAAASVVQSGAISHCIGDGYIGLCNAATTLDCCTDNGDADDFIISFHVTGQC